MTQVGQRSPKFVLTLRLFSHSVRAAFVTVAVTTIVMELAPIPLLVPFKFYTYMAIRLGCFVVLGWVTPLSFWSFRFLNVGLLFALFSAALVESLQFFSYGHSFSFIEMMAKFVLILVGFAAAIVNRHDGAIDLGHLHVKFVSDMSADNSYL
jgi:hypothetical protein